MFSRFASSSPSEWITALRDAGVAESARDRARCSGSLEASRARRTDRDLRFGSLGFANNPTLSGLGVACAIGIFWSLGRNDFLYLAAAAAAEPKMRQVESAQLRV